MSQSSEDSIYGTAKGGRTVTLARTDRGVSRTLTVESSGDYAADKDCPGP